MMPLIHNCSIPGWMIEPKIWNRAPRWFGSKSNPRRRGEALGSPYNGCIIRQHFPSARTLGRRGKYHLWGCSVQGLIMWWGHIIHRLVWERIGWGAPLLPNENQTMFKGTIKIFLQHFIHLGGRGSHPYQSDVHIRITFKERIFIWIKVNFERHEQWRRRLAVCVRLVANFRSG